MRTQASLGVDKWLLKLTRLDMGFLLVALASESVLVFTHDHSTFFSKSTL